MKDIAPNDELAFRELNQLIKQFGSFVKCLLHEYFRGLMRNKWTMFLLLVILSIATFYTIAHPTKEYKGQASFTYNDLTKKFFGEQLNNINDLVLAKDWDKLGSLLQLPVKQVKDIEKIKATNIFNSPLSDDMNESKENIFYVNAICKNASAFNNLDVALENYLNKSTAVQEIIKQKTKAQTEGIIYKTAELKSIDSITKAYTKSLEKQTASIVSGSSNVLDPEKLLEKGEKITQEIVYMQDYLNDNRCVKKRAGFYASIHLAQLENWKIIAAAMGCFVVISVIILFISNTFFSKQHNV